MSLDYELQEVFNYKELLNDDGSPVGLAETMIFMTMFVGIGRITRENALEFYQRVHYYEKQRGSLRTQNGNDLYITPQEVHRFIGLRTNASAETPTQFKKRLWDLFIRETAWEWKQAMEEVEA